MAEAYVVGSGGSGADVIHGRGVEALGNNVRKRNKH